MTIREDDLPMFAVVIEMLDEGEWKYSLTATLHARWDSACQARAETKANIDTMPIHLRAGMRARIYRATVSADLTDMRKPR